MGASPGKKKPRGPILTVSQKRVAFWRTTIAVVFLLNFLYFLLRSPFVNIGVYRSKTRLTPSSSTPPPLLTSSPKDPSSNLLTPHPLLQAKATVTPLSKHELQELPRRSPSLEDRSKSDQAVVSAPGVPAAPLSGGNEKQGGGEVGVAGELTEEQRRASGTFVVLDPAREKILLRQIAQQDASLRSKRAAQVALEETRKEYMLSLKLKQHEMVDQVRDPMRKGRMDELEKLRSMDAASLNAEQKNDLERLQNWLRDDALFTPEWKAEEQKLKKDLDEERGKVQKLPKELEGERGKAEKGDPQSVKLYKEGRESRRKLLLESQAATAMDVFNSASSRHGDKYPLKGGHIPIVLSVRNDSESLRLCLEALSLLEGINETLLVISHDGLFHEPNTMVLNSTGFMRTKQIFNPFSPFLHPLAYPGLTPEDCKPTGEPSPGCIGQKDTSGKYRDPAVVSPKLHWWWTMNTVWDSLAETKEHSGPILFMDQDTLLLPQAYRQIQLLTSSQASICPWCIASQLQSGRSNASTAPAHFLVEPLGETAYAFNRSTWEKLKAHSQDFCFFDDHRWAATLVGAIFPKTKASAAVSWSFPTAHEVSGCIGVKPLPAKCSFMARLAGAKPEDTLAQKGAKVVAFDSRHDPILGIGGGGFGDPRDHGLCLSLSEETTTMKARR